MSVNPNINPNHEIYTSRHIRYWLIFFFFKTWCLTVLKMSLEKCKCGKPIALEISHKELKFTISQDLSHYLTS